MASIQRNLQTKSNEQSKNEEDPNKPFCLSLVQEFKDLPRPQKRLACMKIMQVFCEINGDE